MKRTIIRRQRRDRRRRGLRRDRLGTPAKPRLAVFRSLKHTYAQVIDDLSGRTLCAASTVEKACDAPSKSSCAGAAAVGRLVADRAKEAGVETVVFDRGGFRYHGRIKALADAAREAGLKF